MRLLRNKITGISALWHFDNKWQLLFNRLFFSRHGLLVYKMGGLEFLVDHDSGDHNGTRLCLISNIYQRFLPSMDLGGEISVFDLGANGGGFDLMLCMAGKKPAKLVAVELNPNTFRRLQFNISRNIDGEIALINGAVCGSTREMELHLGSGDISDSIFQDNPATASRAGRRYRMQGYTFDELFQRHFGDCVVDICKMDVEGAEYEIFSNPAHSCLKRCRYFVVELHPAATEKLCSFREAMDNAGFVELDDGGGAIPGERLYENKLFQ